MEWGFLGVKDDTYHVLMLWKWIDIFTEKCSTNRVADLKGKLQSSLLDMMSLTEMIGGYFFRSTLEVGYGLEIQIWTLLT